MKTLEKKSEIQNGINKKPIKVSFKVGKEFFRHINIPDGKKTTSIYHIYPTLLEWSGRQIPDGVNPRSHDPETLKSRVARAIEETITNKPDSFHLANRGSTILAESIEYDPKTGNVDLTVKDFENQGLADGATTDAVIGKVQSSLAKSLMEGNPDYANLLVAIREGKVEIPPILYSRVHLEVFVGLDDRTKIADLVEGRNTSRQVKGWSMSDFRGSFDWLKEILEKDGSPFQGKVGYEENSNKDLNVLDILSILTLFHPEFDTKDEMGKDKAPVIAYSNKGRMDARLSQESLTQGYKSLAPLVPDIIRLWEYIYAHFEFAYDKAFGARARLGRRDGVIPCHDHPIELPLTLMKSNYKIPNGFLFPLLASFRALVNNGELTTWKVNPFEFFVNYGPELISELMDQIESSGNANTAGKKKLVYTALHSKARLALADAIEAIRNKKVEVVTE